MSYDINELLKKPLCMMRGDEFAFLYSHLPMLNLGTAKPMENKVKNLAYGIKGIADIFKCSIPTANRIKKSGLIAGAITQIGRKIVVDVDIALKLAAEAKDRKGDAA